MLILILILTLIFPRPFPIGHHLTFFVLALVVIISVAVVNFIPKSFEKQKSRENIKPDEDESYQEQ